MEFRSLISGLLSYKLPVTKLLAITRTIFFRFFKTMESEHLLWSCDSITTRSQGKTKYITKSIIKSLAIVYLWFMRLVLCCLDFENELQGLSRITSYSKLRPAVAVKSLVSKEHWGLFQELLLWLHLSPLNYVFLWHFSSYMGNKCI